MRYKYNKSRQMAILATITWELTTISRSKKIINVKYDSNRFGHITHESWKAAISDWRIQIGRMHSIPDTKWVLVQTKFSIDRSMASVVWCKRRRQKKKQLQFRSAKTVIKWYVPVNGDDGDMKTSLNLHYVTYIEFFNENSSFSANAFSGFSFGFM